MPYDNDTLPDINAIAGTFGMTVYYDDSLGALTFPTIQTVVSVGELEAWMDRKVAELQPDSLKLEVVDDYTTYTEGFWYKILAGTLPPRIHLVLDEGSGDTQYYFGEVDPLTVSWSEKYIDSTYVRVCEFEIISLIKAISDATSEDWLTEAATHAITTDLEGANDVYKAVKLTTFFASLLYSSGLNSSFDANDCVFISDGSTPELKFTYETATPDEEYDLDDVYLGVTYVDNIPPPVETSNVPYFALGSGGYLPTSYPGAMQLLSVLCFNFVVFPVMTYNGTRFILELRQKGHTYSGTVTPDGGIIESEITRDFDVRVNSIIVRNPWDEEEWFAWTTGEATSTGHYVWNGSAYVFVNTPPIGTFDIDNDILYFINKGERGQKIYVFSGTAGFVAIERVDFYNYITSAYQEATTANLQEEALCLYEAYRLSRRKKVIERTYSSLKFDGSHAGITLLKRMTINDGQGNATYYANRVVKNVQENTVNVQWIVE